MQEKNKVEDVTKLVFIGLNTIPIVGGVFAELLTKLSHGGKIRGWKTFC